MRSSAGFDKIPCVTSANTRSAPLSFRRSAAKSSVPHVSAMSSIKTAILSFASPTRTMRDTSLAFLRSLWKRAKSTPSWSAIDVARFAPPASGDTITTRLISSISRMYCRAAGSEYRLSTGTLKKPWICDACKSIVCTELAADSTTLLFLSPMVHVQSHGHNLLFPACSQ